MPGDLPFGGRRARDYGLGVGLFAPGVHNAITDVAGVQIGHATLIQGDRVRTGVTVVMPHMDNPHRWRVPAGFSIGNGYGKFCGLPQIAELGELETPIALTNTLSVPEVASGLIAWTLALPGNERVVSVNAAVGETNDSLVNDIRLRTVRPADLFTAIARARGGAVEEGSVGAGTGTQLFGWKGGIGSTSRKLPEAFGGYTIGVLVQTNFGGTPIIGGFLIDDRSDRRLEWDGVSGYAGSVIVVIATDAPILARDLRRMAKRAFLGLARTGSSMAHGSGEFALAFSTNDKVLRDRDDFATELRVAVLAEAPLSALFQAVVEATEEAVYNALFAAVTIDSLIGTLKRIPETTLATLKARHER